MIEMRQLQLSAEIENAIPDFARACHASGEEVLLFQQDAFAADLSDTELLLLGKAIKYAGIHRKILTIVP